MSPRSLWHPSQSQYGYGGTPYPDYGARLSGAAGTKVEDVLGSEAKQYWSYARVDEAGDWQKGCTYAFGLDYAWGMSS
jgi:hypothetical protein